MVETIYFDKDNKLQYGKSDNYVCFSYLTRQENHWITVFCFETRNLPIRLDNSNLTNSDIKKLMCSFIEDIKELVKEKEVLKKEQSKFSLNKGKVCFED